MWAAITLGIPLEADAQAAISNVDNSVVAILALPDSKAWQLRSSLPFGKLTCVKLTYLMMNG